MGKYDAKGGYAGYNKNNEEREPLDYYATPPEEVTNAIKIILPEIINNEDVTILEPSCGGGHMLQGIYDAGITGKTIGTDVVFHNSDLFTNVEIKTTEDGIEYFDFKENIRVSYGEVYDFCNKNYFIDDVDYIIMNPPFSLTIPFVNHSLDIAKKGVLMFNRLKFVESQKRYELIFKDNPPTAIYTYVDRVSCRKSGDFTKNNGSMEAYAWFYWDKTKENKDTKFYWIRKFNK